MPIATVPIELARSVVHHGTVLAKSHPNQRSTLFHSANNTQIQLTRARSERIIEECVCYAWTVHSQYTILDESSSTLKHPLYTLRQVGHTKLFRFVLRLSSSHSGPVLPVVASHPFLFSVFFHHGPSLQVKSLSAYDKHATCTEDPEA